MGRESATRLRVRYTEVDRMGVAHHRSHFVWFEIGRTEFLRDAGVTYSEVEDAGTFLPVIEASCAYHAPARYDDLVVVRTTLREMGAARATFAYRIERDADGRLLASGTTMHAAVGPDGRPRRFPEDLRRTLA
jgi:acyl-CoA thioester hydrolase